jgi:hypothetical protein
MKRPHKHAELIKAWADGAKIEFYDPDGNWYPATNPTWSADTEYRVSDPLKVYRDALNAGKVVWVCGIDGQVSSIVDSYMLDECERSNATFELASDEINYFWNEFRNGAQIEIQSTSGTWNAISNWRHVKPNSKLRIKPKGHVHAESMKLYAEDAMVSDTPWENWEWWNRYTGGWEGFCDHPTWKSQAYRRKQK